MVYVVEEGRCARRTTDVSQGGPWIGSAAWPPHSWKSKWIIQRLTTNSHFKPFFVQADSSKPVQPGSLYRTQARVEKQKRQGAYIIRYWQSTSTNSATASSVLSRDIRGIR